MNGSEQSNYRGVLAWFAHNHVAANLLMFSFIVIGIVALFRLTVEVMPELELDTITVTTAYLGASPSEVEAGVITHLENAIDGIEGIEKMRSVAMEGSAVLVIEVDEDYETSRVRDEVEAAVGRVNTLPRETERPVVSEISSRRQVINVVLYGDVSERTLKTLADTASDELEAYDNISQTEVVGVREYEISVELSEVALRRYGLTFAQVADRVRRSSLDLPGGSVRTEGGEILLRTQGQLYTGKEFENTIIYTRPDGTHLYLRDVGTVIDGFEDSDIISRFDGKPAAMVRVFRVGDTGAMQVVEAVEDYLEQKRHTLPEGVSIAVWANDVDLLESRINLLLRNAAVGLALVFVVLSLFLELRLAFWVMAAIPMAFLGSFFVMDQFDVTVNMISLFAMIIVLGLVVDDAIVVGENIFEHRQQGKGPLEAAIVGIREMAGPVTIAVLTTVAAFMPIMFVEGILGKFLAQIPLVVIAVLLISLLDALFVLPSHLSATRHPKGKRGPIGQLQRGVDHLLQKVINGSFDRTVRFVVQWRAISIAVAFFVLMVAVGVMRGGHIQFVFMPEIDSDNVIVSLTMPQGTPIEQTNRVVQRLEEAALQMRREFDALRREDEPSVIQHWYTTIGSTPLSSERVNFGLAGSSGAHLAEINLQLLGGEDRGVSSLQVANRWRELVGEVAGVESLTFTSSLFTAGDAISVELAHPSIAVLENVAEKLKNQVAQYPGTRDIEDTFETGKAELKFQMKPEGRMLGLTLEDLARQVRQGFYGEEAQRIQRDEHEVRIMVRYPEAERESIGFIENMRIRLDDGSEVPFCEVASFTEGRGYSTINRTNRRRVITVKADVDESIGNSAVINDDLAQSILPQLKSEHLGLVTSFEGQQKEQMEAMRSLGLNFIISLFAIYALLAIPFRSYIQPFIVMSAIPFGIIGALIGHLIMGYSLSLMSFFGIVALAGVVVNDSLIIIDYINRHRPDDPHDVVGLEKVVIDAGKRRFRPILLTTLTTFFGLMPMILETSLQARFLIPMTLSLGFGVLFATFITLLLVPALYLSLADLHRFLNRHGIL